ncbi:MAG: pyridoxamine 5'-phosphate oxidase [Anaplasma sp.]
MTSVRNTIGDPMDVFDLWYSEMLISVMGSLKDPAAMTLATCSEQGVPSARVVLLKRYDRGGFEFFTNLKSRKGREIAANPLVALVFDWRYIGRQVRVEGTATFLSASESDAYYASRPRESRIGAWCSKQSMVLEDRNELLMQFESMTRRFEGQDVPRPEFWGGIRVIPHVVEFWTESEHRLHLRKQYSKTDDGGWKCEELYP